MAAIQKLNLLQGTAVAISMVIGSGLFALPGIAIEATDPLSALCAWVIVALCVAPLIHIFSALGVRKMCPDGIAGFAALGIGEWSRSGFALVACGALAVGMPAFFLVIGTYAAELLELQPERWRATFALCLCWVPTGFNLGGARNMSRINQLIVVAILLFMTGVIAVSIMRFPGEIQSLTLQLRAKDWDAGALWTASVIVFWAFQGWENLSFGIAEFATPERNIPRVFWLSFLLVAALYVAFAWVVSAAYYAGLPVTGAAGMAALLGSGTTKTVLLLLMLAVLVANANSWVFGSSRAVSAAAGMGVVPEFLGGTDARGTPRAGLIGSAIAYSLIIGAIEAFGLPTSIAFMLTTQGFIILYGFAILAFLRMHRSSPRAWGVSVLALVGWTFLMSGFSLYLIYPLALFSFATLATLRNRHENERSSLVSPVE